ncbi:MAG: NAD/FAD-utilizing enzyme [Pseudomonadota bacterium]
MKRHYYISDDLEDLEVIERQLQDAGLTTPQIHILSENDTALDEHSLHKVEGVLKKDVVHGTGLGAVVGVLGAGLILLIAWLTGLTETFTWVPAIFLAVVVLGFCTWEGGLIGIGETHVDFRRFKSDLESGKHILFVDFDTEQESIVKSIVEQHPKLQDAGEGSSTPRWVVDAQNRFARFMQTAP